MGTFLTNKKMNPALRARVERSVLGQSDASPSPGRLRMRALLRVLASSIVIVGLTALGLNWRSQRKELAERKAELRAEVTRRVGPLGAGATLSAAVRRHLDEAALDYRGDKPLIEGSLDSILKRPSLYARATVGDGFDEATAASTKDALLLCLLAPPASVAEKELAPKVRLAYRGGPSVETATPNTFRLLDLLVARPFFDGDWQGRSDEARSVTALHSIRRDVDGAQLERAARAIRAEILIYAIDEPKRPGSVVEIDGASDHQVRVGVVDLKTNQTLLRTRRRVEASWISEKRRLTMARGLLDCRLGTEIRNGIAAPQDN